MSKVKQTLLKVALYVLATGLFADLAILHYLKARKNAIIHNIDKDILIDKWWEVCTTLLVLIIPLLIVIGINLLIICIRKAKPIILNKDEEKVEAGIVPTLDITSHNKTKVLTLSDDFDEAFMPHFAKQGYTEYGDSKLKIFKSTLLDHTWNDTELGRIALILFESKVIKPGHNKLIPWVNKFFEMVNRKCPESPSRRDYAFKMDIEQDRVYIVFKQFIEYVANDDLDFINRLQKRKE